MGEFKAFGIAVEKQFNEMASSELYTINCSDNDLWDNYLAAFPADSNPIFKKRTEHDCSCCKQFVRNIGKVVALNKTNMMTVWDVDGLEYPYDVVAKNMSEYVKSFTIDTVFRTKEREFGNAETLSMDDDDQVLIWNHFHGVVNNTHYCITPNTIRGDMRTRAGVFKRALDEFTIDGVNTVVDLINDKMLYRGDEFKDMVVKFRDILMEYHKINSNDGRINFVWSNISIYVAGIRNTVIGTLIDELSTDNTDMEIAVRKFERKVAPINYKRPKSLITPQMIKSAMKTIDALGVRDSLNRRFAKPSDMSVNDVLFVDRDTNALMKDSLEEALFKSVKPKKINTKSLTDISIGDFMSTVVPDTSSMEVMVKGSQANHFMSVTAPIDDSSTNLFQWDNNFAWSYAGNITDSSIKQRVKSAGGNVTAPFRISLGWFNTDDLDIHVQEPRSTTWISYRKKHGKHGGVLDVDMNVSSPVTNAVENVCWDNPIDGVYQVRVHNYTLRNIDHIGFTLEVENNGNIHQFSYQKRVDNINDALMISVKKGVITNIKLHKDVSGDMISQDIWGVNTEQFTKVRMIMNSPNYWHDSGSNIGNKHWFFVLDNCNNPDRTRGIYNEFLRPDLIEHKKVFEILGNETKCEVSDDQLSGIGFSSTQHESIVVKVMGSVNRTFNVQF